MTQQQYPYRPMTATGVFFAVFFALWLWYFTAAMTTAIALFGLSVFTVALAT